MLWQFSATAQTPALANTATSQAATLIVSVYRSGTPMAGLTVAQVAASPQTDFSAFDSAKTYATEPDKPVWLRLRVDTANIQPANLWTLDFDKPFIDKVVLYAVQSDGTWKQQSAGNSLAHSVWPRQSLNPQFNLPELAAGQHDFYVALYNSVPLHVAVTLRTAEEAGVHTQNTFLIAGLIAGLLVFMCIASGVLGFNYRDSACLWYASYAAAVLMLSLSYWGVANYALWTHTVWLRSSCNLIFILAAVALQLQFCRAMFLASSAPTWMRYAVHAMALFCVLSIVPVVVHFNLITQTVFFIAPVLMSIVAMASIVGGNVRRHRVTAWLWMVAYTPLLLLMAVAITEHMGYSSMPRLPFDAPLYALLFEMSVLLIALNVHIKVQHAKVVNTKSLARTDPGTGFVAAHDFAITLDQLWDTAKVSGQDLAVAYVHITHQLRHMAQQDTPNAERSLARAVRLLRSVVREQDVVAHVNKHLFAMLMPDMPLNDNLSARLKRLVALGNMTDKDAAQDAPIRFRIVATTQRSFAGTVQELDDALQHKLNEADGWEKKTIRYVRKRPSHSVGSMVEGESFSQFWERAAQTALESNPTIRSKS